MSLATCGDDALVATATMCPAVTLWPAIDRCRTVSDEVALPRDGVVVVEAPAGSVAAASAPTAATATTDRRDSKRATCTGDPPDSMNMDEARQRDQ